jgi:hypothetical protein
MKRNNLTTAVVAAIAGVAGFAGLANAVDLNPDGLGQVLIYPYYSVLNGQNSLFSVVNTTNVGKAVKVRFLEGYNSREVLDFNLFLSAHDVWTAAITATSAGGGQITTNDKSCTSPTIPAGGQPFLTAGFDGTGSNGGVPIPADAGPQTVTRTAEGYAEIITMADIIPGSQLSTDITHIQNGTPNGGTPPDCSQGDLDAAAFAGTAAPANGGLFGSGSIVNVAQGTFYPYNADAVDGFSALDKYSIESSLSPSLQDANTDPITANPPLTPGATARAFVFIDGQLLTADYPIGVDAVSAVFMADTLYNEYLVDASIGANTDWIVTFPTKRFYVDEGLYLGTPRAPFPNVFPVAGGGPGVSNVTVGINLYDREEGHTTQTTGFSPPVGTAPSALPFEVNVISFLNNATAGGASGVFGSLLRPNITPYGTDGWLALDLTNSGGVPYQLPGGTSPTLGPVTLNGLPATGYEGYNVVNANVTAGVLANYGGLFRHRASRSCGLGDAPAAGPCS